SDSKVFRSEEVWLSCSLLRKGRQKQSSSPRYQSPAKGTKDARTPQHVEPPPMSQSTTALASSMTTTTTDSSSPPEEGDDVIDLVTTDKVGLPDPLPQTVTVPSEPQPSKSRASSIQQLKHIRRPDTQKGTKGILFQGEIIDDLISFPKVCRNLWHIKFLHLDDS
ncbi:hypothetical protein CTAM01_16624, partial [Colletotrichum tamarilloi]